jgi:uncharacterized membrane protein
VHLVDDLAVSPNRTHSYEVVATYAVFFTCGLASYVLSLKLFSRFLRRVVQPQVALATLIALHGLCIVAMYLGRFMRFNSWDVVFAPGAILESVIGVPRPTTLVVLVTMFVVVGVSTYGAFGRNKTHATRPSIQVTPMGCGRRKSASASSAGIAARYRFHTMNG